MVLILQATPQFFFPELLLSLLRRFDDPTVIVGAFAVSLGIVFLLGLAVAPMLRSLRPWPAALIGILTTGLTYFGAYLGYLSNR